MVLGDDVSTFETSVDLEPCFKGYNLGVCSS